MFKLALYGISSGFDDEPPIVEGDSIKYRGNVFDFSLLAEGAEIEVGSPFLGVVSRKEGHIVCFLEYRYSTETAEVRQSLNEQDYQFDVVSGKCQCPIKRKLASTEASNDAR